MTERNQEPTLDAVVRADGTAAVTVDGVTQEIRAADEDSVRQQILERARQRAVIAGHPVRLTTSEPAGRWWLIVHANGQVFEDRSVRPTPSYDPAAGQSQATGFGQPQHQASQHQAAQYQPPQHQPVQNHAPQQSAPSQPFGRQSEPAQSADDVDSMPWSAAIDAGPDEEAVDRGRAAERSWSSDHRTGVLGNLSPTDPSDYRLPNGPGPSSAASQSSAPRSSTSAPHAQPSASQPSPAPRHSADSAPTGSPDWHRGGSSWTASPQDAGALRPSTPQHPPADQSGPRPEAARPMQPFAAGAQQSGPAQSPFQQPAPQPSWGSAPEQQWPPAASPGQQPGAQQQPFSAQQALDAHRRVPEPPTPTPTSGRMPQVEGQAGPGSTPQRAYEEQAPGPEAPGDGRHEPPPSDLLQVQPPGEEPFRKPTLEDLLETRPKPKPGPAEWGVRGVVRKATFGAIKFRPSTREMQHRADVSAIQRSLSGPKTIAVVNPKGGACKTTTTYLIGATFGLYRGGYTLAWDNNETRGTLGWRSIPARHTNTAVDLLADLERFQAVDRARVGDLDNYVRTQGTAQFDVLASDEDAARSATLDGEAFDRLHQTLSRFYRLLIIDTGNNMRASNWIAAVEAADMLVISSSVREDTASSAAWLIDGLRSRGLEHKVEHAVTVLSAPAREPEEGLSRRLHDHFGRLTRAVLDVPHDPTLVEGGTIEIDKLHPETREAWVHVTAAIADGL